MIDNKEVLIKWILKSELNTKSEWALHRMSEEELWDYLEFCDDIDEESLEFEYLEYSGWEW